MPSITEHIIDGEGRVWRETRERNEIVIDERVTKALSKGVVLKRPNIAELPGYGPIGYCHNPADNYSYWTIPVPKIVFRCEAKTVGEGDNKHLVPNFIYHKESKEVIELPWIPGMAVDRRGYNPFLKLVLMIGDCTVHKHSLFAYDNRGAAFRLPIANLFETCELCNGEYDSRSRSELEAVGKAIKQFESAVWISAPGSREQSLYNDGDTSRTASLIRFKPTKTGFETLPVSATNWTECCQKVSVDTLNYVV